MGESKKAYSYLRVSGRGQVEGDGFRRQEAEIATFAQAHGYEVVEVYREEGVSGAAGEADRPAFQDMMSAILRNGVRTIIVEGMDRLARTYAMQEMLVVYLVSKGVTLIAARTGEDITLAFNSDPMKKALIQMQGVFSELEKGMLVKKLRVARERKREVEGFCEGRKAFTQETLPEAVRTALEATRQLRKTNPGQRRRTFNEVAEELNRMGLRTTQGKLWSGSNIQSVWHRFRKLA